MRELDAKIAERLGCEVKWWECIYDPIDDYWFIATWEMGRNDLFNREEIIEGTEVARQPCYKKIIINNEGNKNEYWEVVPFWSKDVNAMLELHQEALNRGWNVQFSSIFNDVYVFIFAFSDDLSINKEEDFLVTLVGRAEGTELPETFARAFYMALYGKAYEKYICEEGE